MKKITAIVAGAGIVLTLATAASVKQTYGPGSRIQMLAHNAYPDHGKYGDRLDRAISSGFPFVVEQDLAWMDGKSILIHGAKAAGTDDPTLESYFIPKIRPLMEKALKDGNKGNWPLVTLYLDIKNDPPEHLEAVNQMLDKYNDWLTTAVKTSDISKQSPLDLKPMMVLVEDKQNDIKQQFFYDKIPVGGKIRAFGSATKADGNPKKLPKAEAVKLMTDMDPEKLFPAKADNYHRWFGTDWAFIESCGKMHGEWTAASEARLKKFVDHGHRMGYFVSLYSINGFTGAENQGWTDEFNFGSKAEALTRWKAAIKAHADFIGTDQYEELAQVVKSTR